MATSTTAQDAPDSQAKADKQSSGEPSNTGADKAPAKAQEGKKDAKPADDKSADSAPEKEAEQEISLHQFLRISGVQPDQSAGFVRWAQKNMGGRHGITDWKQAIADFWRAPAR